MLPVGKRRQSKAAILDEEIPVIWPYTNNPSIALSLPLFSWDTEGCLIGLIFIGRKGQKQVGKKDKHIRKI